MSSGRPQKRRNDSRSRTASSAAGSESVCHCCRSRILNIVKGGYPGAPVAEPWIGESKASNEDQSNAFSIRSRKPPTFPSPLTIASTKEGWERSRRDIGESSSLNQPQRIKSTPFCKDLCRFLCLCELRGQSRAQGEAGFARRRSGTSIERHVSKPGRSKWRPGSGGTPR